MGRVLIAGHGYLGQAAADLFHIAGWEVEGWTRSLESAQAAPSRRHSVVALDIADLKQVSAGSERFDAVIHCASTRGGDENDYRRVYLDGARNLTATFRKAHHLFVSSTSVYAQNNGDWVAEAAAAEPLVATGRVLREAEELVLAEGGVIVRLGAIYGPNRSFLLRKVLKNEAIIDRTNDRFVNQIHRDDAATALFSIINSAVPPGIYNVVDDEPMLQSECYKWLAQKLNRPIPPAGKIPPRSKRGQTNKRVSNAKLRARGWTPRFRNFREGMEKSVLPNWPELKEWQA